jgi:carotenoid cleavage dioxygenase
MAHFPDTLSFTGFNTPSRVEADITSLITGPFPLN